MLAALATTNVPLALDELAIALIWTLDGTDAAIEHARRHPALAGAMALRRVPSDRWTLTTRHDVLTPEQRRNLTETAHHREPFSVEQATVLLAAYRYDGTPDYDSWRQDHQDTEHELKTGGLPHSDNEPHHAGVHPDVRYSLDRRSDT